jgi:hypothetical protein
MTTVDGSGILYSDFLALPTELRCQIYNYLLVESHAITISAGYITVFGHRIQDRARKQEIPGLPLDFAPLVRCHHDASLLSVVKAPETAIDDGWMGEVGRHSGQLGMSAPFALSLTCRLVNDELNDYMRGRRERAARAQSPKLNGKMDESVAEKKEGLSLYVSYPYGILVLKTLYPYLLKQARRVYISGYYTNLKDSEPGSPSSPEPTSDDERLTPTSSFAASSFGTTAPVRRLRRSSVNNIWARSASPIAPTSIQVNATRPRLRLDPPLPRQQSHASQTEEKFPPFSPTTSLLAPAALAQLVRTLLPPEPTQPVQLSTRILYTGENSYGSVWSDENSPLIHILRSICGGQIDMQVKRGSLATGMTLTAKPKPDARIVSTTWDNWRPGMMAVAGGTRRRGRMEVADLDQFLTEIGDKA